MCSWALCELYKLLNPKSFTAGLAAENWPMLVVLWSRLTVAA